ncbi:MAG: alpha-glucosidase [Alphaproteobacteria bacterium]|nr:alpha-glucosidase [Alphaproteobacteria bacterium]
MHNASLAAPPQFRIAFETQGHLELLSDGFTAHIFVLEEDIIRVAVLPDDKWKQPNTWTIACGADDVPYEGRPRMDVSGFTCPAYKKTEQDNSLLIETQQLRLHINMNGFFCTWEMKRNGEWVSIARDRSTQAYNFGWWGEGVYHYLARDEAEKYFGLGECSGDMNRAERALKLSNTDAMGYNARLSQPLYKHIPFYITCKDQAAFGLFYDTFSDCEFDFGCYRSNYHGLFRKFTAKHGDLDYYMIAGPTTADVTKRFTWLTGRPALMPEWSLGYSGSTMSYTDAPNAQERMNEFIDKCKEHDIDCSSFHLSSGYTSIGKKRYVFNWNREKFPDPAAFVKHYADNGIKLLPNIKPCLLRDHPQFETCAAEDMFINGADGKPLLVQFWDELGAYLDFRKPQTRYWWQQNIKEQLLSYGMAAMWNDNNEFELPENCEAAQSKPLQTLLMLKSSLQAQKEFAPDTQQFMVSRAGFAGMQRYVQTWSGDNYTSWETLKYNIKMGLGLALSGVSNTGHDVGGFWGPMPDPELFVRWVECCIFMPRFSIHSWNTDGTANEPWMHESVTHHVHDLIKLRSRLAPYMADLMKRSHENFEPMMRPTFYDFPEDGRCYEENDEFMLGPDLLIAPVVDTGQTERRLYLPKGTAWRNFYTNEIIEGGEEVVMPAPLGIPPLFADIRSNMLGVVLVVNDNSSAAA